jgi:hypothetical protein
MHAGWEFKVNSLGQTWYAHVGMHQVQRWRPEMHEENHDGEEEEDLEVANQRQAAVAAAELLEEIASLKLQQDDIGTNIAAMQGKLEVLSKGLKTKKGDALKAGQVQLQALEKEIKSANQNLTAIKSKLADAQKKLPVSSKTSAKSSQSQGDTVVAGKKGSQPKPVARAKTVSALKNVSSSTAITAAKNTKQIPISRSSTSTITAASSVNSSDSSSAIQKISKAALQPVVEIKEFSRAVERLDVKLLTISDEVCLDIDDQMWAPVKKLSFFPVFERPVISSLPDTKKSAATPSLSTPSKPAATALVKSSATPLNRSSSSVNGSAIPSPTGSARK